MSEVIDLRKEDIKILDTGKSVFTKCSKTEQFGEGASVWLLYTSERVVLLNLLKQFSLMSGQIKKQVYFFRHSNFKIQDSFISHWGSNSLVFRGIVRARNPTNGKIATHTKQILHSSIKCLDTILIHFKFCLYNSSVAIRIIWLSIVHVHWAHEYAVKSSQLDLRLRSANILWHRIRGLVWEQLIPTLEFY